MAVYTGRLGARPTLISGSTRTYVFSVLGSSSNNVNPAETLYNDVFGLANADISGLGGDIDDIAAAVSAAQANAGPSHDSTSDLAVIQTTVQQVQTDMLAVNVDINNTLNDATSFVPAFTGDLVVSVDTTNITTVTQLRRAFDKMIELAQSGALGPLAP